VHPILRQHRENIRLILYDEQIMSFWSKGRRSQDNRDRSGIVAVSRTSPGDIAHRFPSGSGFRDSRRDSGGTCKVIRNDSLRDTGEEGRIRGEDAHTAGEKKTQGRTRLNWQLRDNARMVRQKATTLHCAYDARYGIECVPERSGCRSPLFGDKIGTRQFE
jgi:hypothetical protein